jgi:N-acetylmuramoyl-L-alanine amidase
MTACSFNEPTLRQGVQGQATAVRRLQTCLKGLFQLFGTSIVKDPGAIDGDFGPNTRASVVSFQTNFGSGVADGVVGPITWSQLDTADFRFPFGGLDLNSGDTGNPVRHLQRKLFEAASDPGAVDGIYGNNTQAAVRDFQKKQGLPQNGAAGGQTRVLLSFVQG